MLSLPRIPQLPDLSHVPFCVLALLEGHELRRETIRAELRSLSIERDDSSFCVLTHRLEQRGLIVSRQTRKGSSGASGTKKAYRLTPEGHAALENCSAFYSRPTPVLVR